MIHAITGSLASHTEPIFTCSGVPNVGTLTLLMEIDITRPRTFPVPYDTLIGRLKITCSMRKPLVIIAPIANTLFFLRSDTPIGTLKQIDVQRKTS